MLKNKVEEKPISVHASNKKVEVTLRTTDDKGKEKTIRSKRISNGWILIEEIYVPNPPKGKSSWETKETYYEKNPLAPKDDRTLAEIIKSNSK